jgi:hypothetical protein
VQLGSSFEGSVSLLEGVVSAVGSLSSVEVVLIVVVGLSALSTPVPHGRARPGVLPAVVSVAFVVTTASVVSTVAAVVTTSSVESTSVVLRAVNFDVATLLAQEASSFSHLLLFFIVELSSAWSTVVHSAIVTER